MSILSRLLKHLYFEEQHLDNLCKGQASLEVGDARRKALHDIQELKRKIAAEDKRLAREKKKWMR